MGESITKEKVTSFSPFTKFPSLHAMNEMDLVSKLKNAITTNNGLEQIMKDLGIERYSFVSHPMFDICIEARLNFDLR